MLISLSRRTAFSLLVAVSTAVVAMGGCSRQGEGERCDRAANGNADCDDGLVCKQIDACEPVLDRCCPPEGAAVGTDRCIPVPPRPCGEDNEGGAAGASSGGTSGGDTGGTAGTSGGDTGGTSGGDTGGTSGADAGGSDAGGMSGGGAGEPEPASGAGGA